MIWGIPMAFWLVLIGVFVFASGRRRRWERWAKMDPRYVPPGPPWAGRAGELTSPGRDSYVEQLETRVARLEERLDFTEKLLVERSERRSE
jgi:hypothetical protein